MNRSQPLQTATECVRTLGWSSSVTTYNLRRAACSERPWPQLNLEGGQILHGIEDDATGGPPHAREPQRLLNLYGLCK